MENENKMIAYDTKDKDITSIKMRLEGVKKIMVQHRYLPAVEMVWIIFADGAVIEPTRAEIEDKEGILNINFKEFTRVSQTDVLTRVRDMKTKDTRIFRM